MTGRQPTVEVNSPVRPGNHDPAKLPLDALEENRKYENSAELFTYVLNGISKKYIIEIFLENPVAEFSVQICSTRKLICSSDYDVPRLLTTENENLKV